MAVGIVSTSILADIANAIRMQAGVATTYKPREMAAAVAALDGNNAGNYQPQPYMELESGVLTDPNADQRTWFWAHFYADGEGVLTATSLPDSTRELLASNRICAIAKYQGLGFTPWDGVTGPTHRQNLTHASRPWAPTTRPYRSA